MTLLFRAKRKWAGAEAGAEAGVGRGARGRGRGRDKGRGRGRQSKARSEYKLVDGIQRPCCKHTGWAFDMLPQLCHSFAPGPAPAPTSARVPAPKFYLPLHNYAAKHQEPQPDRHPTEQA